MINIPYLDFINTKDKIITFRIGKLNLKYNEKFRDIQNVKVEISEKILIIFKDPNNLIKNDWIEYDFSKNKVTPEDYEFKYKNYSIIFKNLNVIKYSSDYTKEANVEKIIIKKGKISPKSRVTVWELIDKKSLGNGNFEYDKFKINILNINNPKIKEQYNAEYSFNYECKYNEIEKWNKFTWKIYLMLRFYTGNLFFPQTKITIDKYDNFEIEFNGFDSFGEGESIFKREYNNFSNFLETSFEIFNQNYTVYNLLFTYWINIHDKSFVEIKNLSEFVFFEILVKNFSLLEKGEFTDKLYELFNLENFNLKFINKLFFKEFIRELEKIYEIFLKKYPQNKFISNIFEFYEENFFIFYIHFYRNEIVHKGKINFQKENLYQILNKLHKKIEKKYLNEHKLSLKTVNDFKKYQNHEETFWKGFKKGFKIANEQKNMYSPKFTENIKPLLNEIYETINNHFNENSIELMDPLDTFDRLMIIFLIKLLNINCILTNEPKFYINGEYIYRSKDYISKFLKNN